MPVIRLHKGGHLIAAKLLEGIKSKIKNSGFLFLITNSVKFLNQKKGYLVLLERDDDRALQSFVFQVKNRQVYITLLHDFQ
jgi:hypothetical protein